MTTPSPEAPRHPLLDESPLPYGLPDFAAVRDEDLEPAIRTAIDDHAAEIAAIVGNPEPPTADNTVVALERSGRALDRVLSVFYGLLGPDATPARLAVERVVSPLLAAHRSAVMTDPGLFARVDAVHSALEAGELDLDDETARLVRRHHRDLLRAGAALDDAGRARLTAIDTRLAELTTEFGENLLASTTELAVPVTDEAELAGLPESMRATLAATAADAGRDGWLIPLGLPTVQPITAWLDDAGLRRRVSEASLGRGATPGHDNTPIVLEIVRLRAERARLLGLGSHAEHVLAVETAGTPEAARGLLLDVVDAAVTNARNEAKDLLGGEERELHPADWAWESERLRAERFRVDDATVRPYFELERVLHDGVMHAASELYGLRFAERTDLAGYLPDVRVIEVFDDERSQRDAGVGLLLLDYYARPTKRGGAWMSSFRDQSRLLDSRPVVVNVMNLARPAAGQPTLLTMDEVTTMFHEFGHALHGLLSDVEYPVFSGTSVPRDFVEFPSQVNEMWARRPEMLARYARHVETGEPIGEELVERMREAERFGEGQATVEYLAAALIDLEWHSLTPKEAEAVTDVDEFEARVLADAGLDVPGIEPRYRSRYFQHIFAGGYSAAYYSYFWAEVLDADAAEWFVERGGLKRDSGDRMRREVLSRGGAIDFLDAYRRMRGSEPNTAALLRRRGLDSSVVGGRRAAATGRP
ncbi:M3 family metallopeptidase [Dietzia cinnamea]|uniref:M3 family metallopeptidase n=1 Tax=Dietzia cinnamea TaxID=321318 RepID=A0ABV3YK28_9ACTN|nr:MULTISPECIES: M3 family metallopeptidase [Dietzia]AVM64911.1 M3 family peptidase [Dietzia sp. oral taxon 368]MCT2139584.1 M3 family metallopeptidase [Dietzia cinnamea]